MKQEKQKQPNMRRRKKLKALVFGTVMTAVIYSALILKTFRRSKNDEKI